MACERCWATYTMQYAVGDNRMTYQEILQRNDGVCSPEDQCGEMHTPITRPDGRELCACEYAKEVANG